MSTFANVNVGATANDGTGDPLRNAFIKIDQNFANIASGSPNGVSSVAGRSGNVVLYVNDVIGAANVYFVTSQVAAGNAYVDSQIVALGNINVVALANDIHVLDANVGNISSEIIQLFSNASLQAESLTSLASDVSTLTSSLSTQQNEITATNASVVAANLAIITANTGMRSYVNTANVNMKSYVDTTILNVESYVNTANVNMKYYVDTANVGMKSYVDTANVNMQNHVYVSNVSMKSYVDNITKVGNLSVVDQTITGLNDGNPLIIGFATTRFLHTTIFEDILTANATSTVTNTNTGSIQIPNGGLGVAGSAYFGTLPNTRIQVGTGGQLLPNVLAQFTSNVNNYAQVNMQNLNNSPFSSSDFVATANNGNDTQNFIDLGIAGSTYNFPGYGAYRPNDGYLLVDGGNLLLNTDTVGKYIKFIVGGLNDSNQVGQFSSVGLSVNGNISSTGNISAPNLTSQFSVLNANIGAYEIYANANSATQQTQITSLYTGANANTAAYLTTATITTTGNVQAGNLITTLITTPFGTGGNLTIDPDGSADVVINAANVWLNAGHLRSSASTFLIANATPTTAYMFGNASNIYLGATNGTVTAAGNVVAKTYRTIPTTVSSLPSASVVGAGTRAFVTDANTTTFGTAVGGTGANSMPVFSNGTAWYIG